MDISIIIPAYNAENFLSRAIRSAASQNYPRARFEIIVINDGSTDHTEEVARDAGDIIRLITYPDNRGLPAARNRGIRAALGRYVINLDADDYLHEDILMVESLFLYQNPNWGGVACDYYYVDSRERHVARIDSRERPIACGVMFRKDALVELGLYDENMRMNEEQDLRLRFLEKFTLGHIPLPLYRYRRHDGNMTNNQAEMARWQDALEEKHKASQPAAAHTLDPIVICGMGSIGQRHAQVLRSLKVPRIDALRSGKGVREVPPTLVNVTHTNMAEALAAKPRAAIVANPTALHGEVLRPLLEAGVPTLVEKPFSASLAEGRDLYELAQRTGTKVAVGYNLRYYPSLRRLRQVITSGELGPVLAAHATFHAWVPGWHPLEDFRQGYVCRQELGGGALLTHSHEINYLQWLFGPSVRACGATRANVHLDTGVDESANGVIQHEGGVTSTFSLALFSKTPGRTLEITFEAARIRIDLTEHSYTLTQQGARPLTTFLPEFTWDQTYTAQDQEFLAWLEGADPGDLCTLEEACADLNVIEQIRS